MNGPIRNKIKMNTNEISNVAEIQAIPPAARQYYYHQVIPTFHKLQVLYLLDIFFGELFGVMFLVYFGCAGMYDYGHKHCPGKNETTVYCNESLPRSAIVWGFTITACVTIFGPITQAHLNPCATITAILFGHIKPIFCPVYLVAQLIGSYWGDIIRNFLTPGFSCVPKINEDISNYHGFIAEFIGTGFLIFAACDAFDPRTAKYMSSIPLKLGLTVSVIVFAIGDLTGASLNPARQFGPTLRTSDWTEYWIYLLAQLSSATIVSLVYKYVFLIPTETEEIPKTLSEEQRLEKIHGDL